MGNWNLETYDNIYASLAESAYHHRPKNFPNEELNDQQKERIENNQSVQFNFSQDGEYKKQITQGGGTDLPNGGIVYLQPDKQGLLEDEATGYNGYFVTDTETINQDTHQFNFNI